MDPRNVAVIAAISPSILLPYSPLYLKFLQIISLFNLMILSWAFSCPPTESRQNPFIRFCIILLKFRQINKHMTNNIILLEGVMMLYHLTEGPFNLKLRWRPRPSWIKAHLISALNPVLRSKDWTIRSLGAMLSMGRLLTERLTHQLLPWQNHWSLAWHTTHTWTHALEWNKVFSTAKSTVATKLLSLKHTAAV